VRVTRLYLFPLGINGGHTNLLWFISSGRNLSDLASEANRKELLRG
jgi:hypothetical protein